MKDPKKSIEQSLGMPEQYGSALGDLAIGMNQAAQQANQQANQQGGDGKIWSVIDNAITTAGNIFGKNPRQGAGATDYTPSPPPSPMSTTAVIAIVVVSLALVGGVAYAVTKSKKK